ncbi:MYCBP-associated protein-like isoform X2 [Oxyura jamaicensis]|uniref:MYCBP-associated protein-like isoform X2 n=1 Tax=Oxyura jamaicensis TaxID=8884 RepID=UPI0015A6B894|nr:MYCBP-associated protein-like isoform X2 [Oxyura jamaicensis]
MAVRGWRPAVAALAAAGRPRGSGPGGASAPGAGPGPEPGAVGEAATAALYVHWPYCRKHCSYCSFNKYVVPAVDEAAVRSCLVREARTLLRLGQVQRVTSVFFGGGTPSLASPQTIAAVLEAAVEAAHLPAGAEVTLEANPSSASPARLAGFRAAGVNRLSVGVQSLDDAELRLLGREHTADEARAAVEAARGLFPGRTSIDLLFGLPGQSREAWARCLEAALGLCDDHLALYQLTLERGTALEAQVRRGALPAPPQDLLADMYHTARAVLAAAGFRQYEVSNFARKGALSTHNLSYWRAEQYIGVGPGAHGRFVPWGEGSCQREARVQTPDPDTWMREVQSCGHGTRRRAALNPLEQLEELLALGLRTDEGVTQQRWGRFSPQLPLRAVFGVPGEAMALQQQGWLLLDGGGLRCTSQGLAVLDSLLPGLLCQLQRCWAHTAGTGGRGTEERGGEAKKKVRQTPPSEHRALQNWHRNMAIRKKQEKYLGEILQKPENELLMSISEDYRQIQEERDLIDRSLPALFPGKGYRTGSEFWSQPERIGDELTGLMLTLTQRERGYPAPVTHVGKPHTVRMETGLKPPKRIPFRLTWDKSLFLKRRRQELKSVLEELDFYKPDLDGLEVIGKGQPFTSVSMQSPPCSTSSEKPETLDSLGDYYDLVPEAVWGPSLDFCGQPARWINCITSCRHIVGIAARLTFETVAGEKAESFLTVSNDGTAAVWYNWRRLLQQIPSRETKRMQCFYFDARPGVILPGETRKFVFLFKSERAGIFSESWEFRTHPLLLGGALLQVTLWGIAVYEDKLADLREKLESDLAAKEGAAIVEETLKELLVRIRTPERTPSPVDAYVTEEDLFHRKNPKLHYQHRVVKQLQELWRQHVTVPPASEEKVPSDLKSSVEDMQLLESVSEALSTQGSATETPDWRSTLDVTLSQVEVEKEEPGPSAWNFSFEDFKQAIKLIPKEEQREEALTQLNKAALELCVEQRPTQSDLLYQTCLQLWRETIDGLVCHSLKLRSLLGLPEKDTCVDVLPEETVEVKQPIKGGKEDKITSRKEERRSVGGKDKEDKKRTSKTAGKEKEERPNSRKTKVKDEKKLKSSTSSQKVKEVAQAVEAVVADPAEPPQQQVDPILFGTYQEKLYIEVYELLDSMVSKMLSLFEELEKKGALKWESEALCN